MGLLYLLYRQKGEERNFDRCSKGMQMQLTAALLRMYADKRVKVKFTLERTMKAQAGRYNFTFSLTSALYGMGGQRHAPDALLPRKRPGAPCTWGLGGLQGRSGRVRKFSPLLGFDPRSIQPVASRYTKCTITVHIYAHTLLISMSWGISTVIIQYNIDPESYDFYWRRSLPTENRNRVPSSNTVWPAPATIPIALVCCI